MPRKNKTETYTMRVTLGSTLRSTDLLKLANTYFRLFEGKKVRWSACELVDTQIKIFDLYVPVSTAKVKGEIQKREAELVLRSWLAGQGSYCFIENY